MNKNYSIDKKETIQDALKKIEANHLGLVVVKEGDKVIGVLSDGDIRNVLIRKNDFNIKISEVVNTKFTYLFEKDSSRENILKLLDTRIRAIPILTENYILKDVVSVNDIDWSRSNNVISKAKSPVRITFSGGGTDLTSYYYDSDGIVFNATINKYTHAVLERRLDSSIQIISYDLDEKVCVNDISDLKLDGALDLIKSIIINLNPSFGFNLYTYSDIPSGSGLGGSAVVASAIIGAFNNFRDSKLDIYEIAELAFQSERITLGLDGGWQDQYATVFGGFNYIEFNDEGNVVNPLKISSDTLNELEDTLLLCYTGKNHNSGYIHDDMRSQMKKADQKKYAEKSKEIAYKMKSKLLQGKLNDFGLLLGEAWKIKKKFSDRISNDDLDAIYEYAIEKGALGGKLLGAGDGGYFLFYVPTKNKMNFIKHMKIKNMQVDNFNFDELGLRTWLTKTKL